MTPQSIAVLRATCTQWLDEHPEHPDALSVREALASLDGDLYRLYQDARKSGYTNGYRDGGLLLFPRGEGG